MSRPDFVTRLLTADLAWLLKKNKFKKFLQEATPYRSFVIELSLKCECHAHFFYQIKNSQLRLQRYGDGGGVITVEYFVPVGSGCPTNHLPEQCAGFPVFRIDSVPFTHYELFSEIENQRAQHALAQVR